MSRLIQARSDAIDWSTVVVGLRELFDRHGVATDLGALREWTSDTSEAKMPVRVVVEPEGDDTRVTVERKTWPSAAGILSGAATLLAVCLIIVGLWIAGGGTSNIWFPALVFGMFAGLIGIGGYGLLRSNGRKTLGRFQAALDLIYESTSSESRVAGMAETAVTARTIETAAPPADAESRAPERIEEVLDLDDESHRTREITGPGRPRETER